MDQALIDMALDAVDDDVRRHGRHHAWPATRAFLIAHFNLLDAPVPDVATRGLQTAQRYLAGEVDAAELLRRLGG